MDADKSLPGSQSDTVWTMVCPWMMLVPNCMSMSAACSGCITSRVSGVLYVQALSHQASFNVENSQTFWMS